ncbi:MAG TPA: hypothetical protein PLT31_07600 [Fibrobacteraceae bacterium]|jgi:hypothetical protein|nr:hypothetical protein [Fibrobacteraceae bacterium]
MNVSQKKEILASLNWDSSVTIDELLNLVEGKSLIEAGISRESFFLRCLERVPWHNLIVLWDGVENSKKLYTNNVRRGLRNGNLRRKFDFVFGILRGESVQAPEWSSEYCQKLKRTFLPDRWNRA